MIIVVNRPCNQTSYDHSRTATVASSLAGGKPLAVATKLETGSACRLRLSLASAHVNDTHANDTHANDAL